MVVADIAFSIFVALLLSLIFIGAFRTRGPWGSFALFFLIIFLAAWAGSIWIQPVGPLLWGVAWVPILAVALLMALLLAAVTHRGIAEDIKSEPVPETPPPEEVAVVAAIGLFFWIFIMGLLLVIIIGYLLDMVI